MTEKPLSELAAATQRQALIQKAAEGFDVEQVENFAATVAAVKNGDEQARVALCAGLLNAGFRNPFATVGLYDQLTEAWLGKRIKPQAEASASMQPAPEFDLADSDFTAAFWDGLWQLLNKNPVGAGDLTARVAALGGLLDTRFGVLAEALACSHPGAATPQQRTPPPMTDLTDLGAAPKDSLAGELHSMLVVNGYDAEVLDRQALGLSQLPPGLAYLNTRILQMHDVWHLAAGYRTTALHEIAISSFQLAQFGHNYSAMFLAVVLTTATLQRPEGLPILLQIVSEAWQHGRTTVSFMAIDWEAEWHRPIAQLRAQQNIEPFTSTLPADLFETLARADEALSDS